MENTEKVKDLLSFLSKRRNKLQSLKSKLSKKGNDTFKHLITNIFDAIPSLQSIVWTQYTPYHRDGDVCEFEVNQVFFLSFIDESEDEDPENYVDICEDNKDSFVYSNHEYTYIDNINEENLSESEKELIDNLSDFMTENSDILLEMFGDHVKVFVTREGIKKENYDHD